jgi:hypothetical protein
MRLSENIGELLMSAHEARPPRPALGERRDLAGDLVLDRCQGLLFLALHPYYLNAFSPRNFLRTSG